MATLDNAHALLIGWRKFSYKQQRNRARDLATSKSMKIVYPPDF